MRAHQRNFLNPCARKAKRVIGIDQTGIERRVLLDLIDNARVRAVARESTSRRDRVFAAR